MAMNNSAYAYQQEQAYERQSSIRVLDGRQAREKENARRSHIVKSVIAVSVVFALVLAVTFASAKIYGLGVQLNSIKAEIEDVHTATARAEMELGEMASLERIEEYAVANLDMVYPGANDFYYLTMEAPVAAEAEQVAVEAEAETESGVWDKLIDSIVGFFRGSASAATY